VVANAGLCQHNNRKRRHMCELGELGVHKELGRLRAEGGEEEVQISINMDIYHISKTLVLALSLCSIETSWTLRVLHRAMGLALMCCLRWMPSAVSVRQ
jgi:hypothetical protein